jgi:type II secretory pathway predicted ATPase ExeA
MYYEYWGLKKPPFDNVPDPTMYVASHNSVENTIAETLFAIEEGNECIAVIVGDVGLGKTMSLRMVIDSLDQHKYKIAFITNPDIPFVQLLREIIGQLTGAQCEEKRKVDLLETFNKLLFQTLDEGRKVLIFIDEANAMSPANLESLRLLTNMQNDNMNLFTIVLAGQTELARRLEHPRRANLFQRIGTYCMIDKIESEELVKNYVETRLMLAGGAGQIFTDDAISALWEYSDYGVPRVINKICKLSLKAGETNGLTRIDGAVTRQIAERFERLTGPSMQKRKPRTRDASCPSQEDIVPTQDGDEDTAAGVERQETRGAIDLEPKLATPGETSPEEPIMAEPITEEPSVPAETSAPHGEDLVSNVIDIRSTLVRQSGSAQQQFSVDRPSAEEPVQKHGVVEETATEAMIGTHMIRINIPSQFVEQAQSDPAEHGPRLAGVLAAQTLQDYPQLTNSFGADPVAIWSEIRDVILGKLRAGVGTARR